MKKSFYLLLTMVCLLSSVRVSAFTVDGINYGIISSDDLTCRVEYDNGVKYSGAIVIPEKVTDNGNTYAVVGIGAAAFFKSTNLTSVTIPNTVTEIGHDAFASCSNLTNVTMENSVVKIGYSAFSSCSSLTSITISSSVTEIDRETFGYCESLTDITIPESVTKIGSLAFSGCI